MNRTDSFRCSICGLNWPHHIWFRRCLQCGDDIGRGVVLQGDYALTMEEAREYCIANDLDWPGQPHITGPMGNKQLVPKPKGHTHFTREAAVKKLHEDLDRWAEHAPDWMKR